MGSDSMEREASLDRTSGYFDSQTETMSRTEREGYVLGKLRAALEHGYTHAPSVKALMDQAGVGPQGVRSLTDLERLPVLHKDQLVELQQQHPPFGGFLGVPPEEIGHI